MNCQTAVVHKNTTKRRSKIYKSQYIFRYNILTVKLQSSPNCRATRSIRSGQLCDQSSWRVVNVAVAVARDHSRTSQHHSTSSHRQMSTPALIALFHPPSLPSPSHALHRPPKLLLLLLLLINCRASHLTRASSVRPTGQTLTLQRVQTIRDAPRR